MSSQRPEVVITPPSSMRAITICPPLKGWFNSLPLRPLQHISATIPNGVGIDEDIQHWLRFAESDMVSAEALHRAGQELNALFHLQQAVERL